KRPEDRYPTPAAFAAALAGLTGEKPAPRPGITPDPNTPLLRRRLLILTAVGLVSSAILLSFLLARGMGWLNAVPFVSTAPALSAPRALGRLGGPVRVVTFTLDGTVVAAAADDGIIQLWDRSTGQERPVFRPRAATGEKVWTVADRSAVLLSWCSRKADVT